MTRLRSAWARYRRILRAGDPEPVALLTGILLAVGGVWILFPWGHAAAVPDWELELPIGVVFLLTGGVRSYAILCDMPRLGRWAGLATSGCWAWLGLSICMITAGANVSWLWYIGLMLGSGWAWDRMSDDAVRSGGASAWEGPGRAERL